MSNQPDEILTVDEVAAYLKAGKLPAFKLGGTWRFCRGDLDSWIGKAAMEDKGTE